MERTYTKRRQRLAEQSIEKYGWGRLFAAGCYLMYQDRGVELPDPEKGEPPLHPSVDEVCAFFETLDEKGIKRLCRMADAIGEGEEVNFH